MTKRINLQVLFLLFLLNNACMKIEDKNIGIPMQYITIEDAQLCENVYNYSSNTLRNDNSHFILSYENDSSSNKYCLYQGKNNDAILNPLPQYYTYIDNHLLLIRIEDVFKSNQNGGYTRVKSELFDSKVKKRMTVDAINFLFNHFSNRQLNVTDSTMHKPQVWYFENHKQINHK